MKKFILLATITLLYGCANVGANFNADDIKEAPYDAATVYFYRPSKLAGSALTWPIVANGVEIGTLDYGAYFMRTLSPGAYQIHSDSAMIDRVETINFEAGRTYFVKCYLDMGLWVNSIRLVLVHPDQAIPEIQMTSVQLYN